MIIELPYLDLTWFWLDGNLIVLLLIERVSVCEGFSILHIQLLPTSSSYNLDSFIVLSLVSLFPVEILKIIKY